MYKDGTGESGPVIIGNTFKEKGPQGERCTAHYCYMLWYTSISLSESCLVYFLSFGTVGGFT
jgi:hypothetical protein